MSEPILQPVLATRRFKAFRLACVPDASATIVDLERATFATPLQGAATLFIDDDEIHVDPLQIVVVRPDRRVRAVHHGCTAKTCALLVGLSKRSSLSRVIGDKLRRPAISVSIPLDWVIRLRCFVDSRQSISDGALEAVEQAIEDRLEEALLTTGEDTADEEGHGPLWEPVELVRRRLAEDFDRRLSLDELSEAIGLSKFHLARTFHQATGHSIHRYQTLLRLEAALIGLHRGEENLTDLALELGFSSHSHLTSVFRGLLGVTPSEARSMLAGVGAGSG